MTGSITENQSLSDKLDIDQSAGSAEFHPVFSGDFMTHIENLLNLIPGTGGGKEHLFLQLPKKEFHIGISADKTGTGQCHFFPILGIVPVILEHGVHAGSHRAVLSVGTQAGIDVIEESQHSLLLKIINIFASPALEIFRGVISSVW